METSKKDLLKSLSNLLIIFVLLVLVVIILTKSHDTERNIAKDFRNEFSDLLEIMYDENFKELNIDYKDPILLSRNIYLTTDLDEKAASEIMVKLKYLESLDNKSEINLFIETSGGYGGIMLANYLQTISCPINTIALDYCSSAGCELLASGTGKRKAFSTSRINVHIVQEENTDIDDETFNSVIQQQKINNIFWKKYSKLPEEFYLITENRFYNFTADEALKYGIIDEIL